MGFYNMPQLHGLLILFFFPSVECQINVLYCLRLDFCALLANT